MDGNTVKVKLLCQVLVGYTLVGKQQIWIQLINMSVQYMVKICLIYDIINHKKTYLPIVVYDYKEKTQTTFLCEQKSRYRGRRHIAKLAVLFLATPN